MKQKLESTVRYLRAGINWNSDASEDCDLDLSAFLLDGAGRVKDDSRVVFYNQTVFGDHALVLSGDNPNGEGDGMNESIFVDLGGLPSDAAGLVFCVCYSHEQPGFTFGEAHGARFVVCPVEDKFDKGSDYLTEVHLTEDYPACSGMAVWALTRTEDGWSGEVIAEPVEGGLTALCARFGVEVQD